MVRRSRTERTASAGARVAGRGVGTGIGAALSSPFGFGALALGALIIGLVIFRKDIGAFFGNLKLPTLPDITFPSLPDIKFPDFNFPDINFPDFNFPELPDFSAIFAEQQKAINDQFQDFIGNFQFPNIPNPFAPQPIPQPQKMVTNTGLIDLSQCACGSTITQDAFGNVESKCKQCAGIGNLPQIPPASSVPSGTLAIIDFLGLTPAQQFAAGKGGFNVPANDPLGIGGGGSFIGGSTTFGSGIVDTLSEVLAIFPNLTASQAADALAQNVGLTKNEFAQVDPDIVNISSAGGDPDQIILNASGGFSGLTPQQIALILTGGNISNF